MDKINKNDIINILSERLHLTYVEAKKIIDSTFDLMKESLINGQEVNISNFGSFIPKIRPARKGCHPSKHTEIKIDETTSVVFKPSRNFKSDLND